MAVREEIRDFELRERKDSKGETFYAARLRPLGLTAYGDTKEQAVSRLKQMFGIWLDHKYKVVESLIEAADGQSRG